MEHKLQNLVFPSSSDLEEQYELFYRGYRARVDYEKQELHLADNSVLNFTTYLNSCSVEKWKKYTELKELKLRLEMTGSFAIEFVGYHLNARSICKKSFAKKTYTALEKEYIEFIFPDNDETLVGFEIIPMENCTLHEGAYYGIYDLEAVKDVTLCLATTTCHKEQFITHNMELLQKEILEADDDMKNHFYVHVIDNGETLDAEALSGWHMTVHPNHNTGGAGGFTRGMIEALENAPKATHVLLMDDDVVMLPESIRRTYQLLQVVKPAYSDAIIGGAMLRYEEMNMQHEDIGTVFRPSNLGLRPLKPALNQRDLFANLYNEGKHYGSIYQYQAWWYCCIPIKVVEENRLPLPIFIRCDDVEYGLRCKKHIITMNGICVWHMAFVNKYNLAMDRYQIIRNLLIDRAVGSISDEMDLDRYAMLCFRSELLKYNYNGAEICLKALKDYMKGPRFLEKDQGEKILKENVQMNEKFVPLEEFKLTEFYPEETYWDVPRKRLDTLWYRITFNGQRFWPTSWLKESWLPVLFNDVYQPAKYTKRRNIFVVNPELKIATNRLIDKKKYKRLKKDWDATFKYYKKHKQEIEKEYKDAFPYLTSKEFWKKYLEIE